MRKFLSLMLTVVLITTISFAQTDAKKNKLIPNKLTLKQAVQENASASSDDWFSGKSTTQNRSVNALSCTDGNLFSNLENTPMVQWYVVLH
jgi:ABC-type transport system involved in cytochrome bd biosynthesis fused ATPase/permease subunit